MLRYILGLIPFLSYAGSLQGSFYDFELDGVELESPPQAILLVNIASQCGLVAQLKDLEELYQKYKDRGLVVIGVPSADFLNQEPLDTKQVKSFCQLRYGVSFPIARKSHVTGSQALPLYQWLAQYNSPKWNFHKYLFNSQGHLVADFWPNRSPLSSKIEKKIFPLLSQSS